MSEEQLEMQDCYHKAEEGEPKFTLLARDPIAPYMILMWASLREGDNNRALQHFSSMISYIGDRYAKEPTQLDKLISARKVSTNIFSWQIEHK